jgi:fumarate hydratase subunit beta
VYNLTTPIKEEDISKLKVSDVISLSGYIYCGRDAVLPKIVKLCSNNKLADHGINLNGSLIFHTAVSPAGIGPTSSNKLEIEESIVPLSKAGVKIHLGKGKISKATIDALNQHNSIFAVVPPVTALLQSKVQNVELVAFPEEGMEAFYRLKVKDMTMIVAAAHGKSIYEV